MESIAMDLSNMENFIWKQVKQFWAAQCLTMDRRPLPGLRPSILTSPGLGSLIWGSVFHFIFDEFDKLVNHDRPCCENISKWFDHRRNLESQNNVRILKYSSIGIVCSVIIEITKSFDKFEHIVPLVSIHPSVWRSLNAVTISNIFKWLPRRARSTWTVEMNLPLNIHWRYSVYSIGQPSDNSAFGSKFPCQLFFSLSPSRNQMQTYAPKTIIIFQIKNSKPDWATYS